MTKNVKLVCDLCRGDAGQEGSVGVRWESAVCRIDQLVFRSPHACETHICATCLEGIRTALAINAATKRSNDVDG